MTVPVMTAGSDHSAYFGHYRCDLFTVVSITGQYRYSLLTVNPLYHCEDSGIDQ